MKKLLALLFVVLMLTATFGVCALAAEEATLSATAYVTIAAKGQLVVTQEAITVTDIDSDGALTVNDALYCAHEAKYDGGAAGGYSYYTGDYGLSLGTLWGDKSGSYGYYVNNNSCFSLADPVKDGDCVTAFVYASSDWSDVYSYFDITSTDAKAGQDITLTLSYMGYDANWAPVYMPVENATITINGNATEYKTDKDGKVTIKLPDSGSYVISAVSSTQTLVPPVCKVNVAANPDAGDSSLYIMMAAMVFIFAATTIVAGKKVYEK